MVRNARAYIGILFLLALAGVDWWREHIEKRVVAPELATLYQALKCLLLAFAIGIVAVMIVAVGTDRPSRCTMDFLLNPGTPEKT